MYFPQYSRRLGFGRRALLLVMAMGLGGLGFGADQPKTAVPENKGISGNTAVPVNTEVPVNVNELIDKTISSEHALMKTLSTMHPLVETYIQEQQPDKELGVRPLTDHYFLGRLDLSDGLDEKSYILIPSFRKRLERFKLLAWKLNMVGWAQPAIMDYDAFDRDHYEFSYAKRQFLGDVRCFVFDVKPKPHAGPGRFMGSIWVEDEGYRVVRFNGTYGPPRRGQYYAHFDSWRTNPVPNLWVPAVVYAEDRSVPLGLGRHVQYKAQVRYWGYQLAAPATDDEHTKLTVEAENGLQEVGSQFIDDKSFDISPLAASRLWQRQAENNVLDRLTRAGFLAPYGEVDKILETVLNNIEVTNDLYLEPKVRVRVLLTTPFESFTVGHTIVISRGFLDVLPDEAALAAIISHELAHISLGHQVDTGLAFTDRFFFNDEDTLKNLSFTRDAEQEADADRKALEFLKKSPYSGKLTETGLFLRQLSAEADQMPNLIRPLLGSRIAGKGRIAEKGMTSAHDLRLSGLMEMAPPLRPGDINQVSALPLGSRIRMDSWTTELSMMKSQRLALLSPKEKLPFEVVPFMLHLTRQAKPPVPVAEVAIPTQ